METVHDATTGAVLAGHPLALSPDATQLAHTGTGLGGLARTSVVDLAIGARRD